MEIEPITLVEPIVIGFSSVVLGLILFGIYLRRPDDPAAIADHRRIGVFMAIALVVWFVIDFGLARFGVFESNSVGGQQGQALVPNIAIGIGVPLLAGLAVILTSRRLGEVMARVPQSWIIGVQLYRVVGGVFLYLYAHNLLPGEFALPAGIGDILVGIAAPVVAYAVARGYAVSRGLTIAWNIAGIGDLAVAVAAGFLSTPGLYQRLSLDAPNTLISAYPLVMIPLFAVPLSIFLHVISLRRVFSGN
jgi:hypothetical protein